jgi:hypothetical protein
MNDTQAQAKMTQVYLQMIRLLHVYLAHFPRHEKYALCNRIRNTAYEVFDYITEGHKVFHKKTTLRNLDVAHEKLRMQIYLAYEMGYLGFKDGRTAEDAVDTGARRLKAIGVHMDELGRMIGGWIKSQH